jgi:superfamily II DNA or RNA helicase
MQTIVKPKNIMKTQLSHQGYHINLHELTKDQLETIQKELTVVPEKLDATKEENDRSKFSVYSYSNDRLQIIVPRYYGIAKFGTPHETLFEPEEIDIGFYKELRDKQKVIVEKCIKYILKHGGGLLSVPCGFGKTVCALYMAHRLGLKTLIVVHKSNLLNQWVERIVEFLKIDKKRIGIIRQNVCTSGGKDIAVGMIQTISKRNFKDIFNKFGFVIYDEAHHVACKYYSRALLKTGAQYTLALTATPYRGDGMIRIMYWFLGGTIYREKIKVNKNVVAKIINYKSTDKNLFALKMRWFNGKNRPNTTKMINNICTITGRNKKIIQMINHIRQTDPERKILVLSGRKNHLMFLKKGVDELIQKDVESGLIDSDEIMSCCYTGETSNGARQDAEERGDIIFATYDMAHEGLDIKHLNTVILASPKKDIVQSIGRIMRKILQSGDIRPLIIDIGDDLDVVRNWAKIRLDVYNKCKYEIKNYYITNDRFQTFAEYNHMTYHTELSDNEVHHPDVVINSKINEWNKCLLSHKKDVAEFRRLCDLIQSITTTVNPTDPIDLTTLNEPINQTNQTDQAIIFNKKFSERSADHYYSRLEENEYKILEGIEPTNLTDILYVAKLTERDIEREVMKDAENADRINLDQDIGFDRDDNMDIPIPKKQPNIPTKKLFR